MYKHIIVPVDGSKNARRAAKEAATFASCQTDAFIELLFVSNFKKSDNSREQLEQNVKQITDEIENDYMKRNIDYKITMLHGQPGREIVRHADSVKADLIVIGSRGLNALQKVVLGSVSQKVVTQAKTPVLLIK